ncbi:hypothetical protein PVK06_019371 [Gossypium arboreum]|uniref:DUF7725 domain-containing protein n=1 Tax=Gossypium arboreum TaxID=29729 RepID=A0ABR0PJU3_GOSAR|nr:hypothetical protein PVK06_019371 [Gossypium arboreum]
MEIPKGAHNQFDFPKGGVTDKFDFGEEENPFHDVGLVDHVVRGELKERSMHALQSNKGGINVEVVDSLCKMQTDILILAKTSGIILLDERSLLACIVCTILAGGRIQTSSTLPIKLGNVLPPSH